ncbi:hypothetical protein [Clostridium chromiireducens]|uniref:Uncharacterized protein n=1 Tax=Clostridium chromiireducens TaxID=225345 RepID=A0A1V4IKJ8_9CLOT|nr:hypothetical protein [Clostridium chromiireducens]MVX67329.1 hypothetical protein [Clostridium chromiireducens]OPJ60354.1 hypothetical protein CLCHR_29730 [Clostridium chromiireducens]RII33616.1 hypothetical protein D2A34_17980 [Clostridium chromiireducens]
MGLFEIGKPFEDGVSRYPEGVKFDIRDNECNLLLYAEEPTEKERLTIMKDDLKYGYFKEDNVIVMLFRFGNHQWIDIPYSVNMSRKVVGLKEISEVSGYLFNIYIINAKTGIIEEIRTVELDPIFSKKLREDIEEQSKLGLYGFRSKVDEVYRQFSVKALVSMSRVLV